MHKTQCGGHGIQRSVSENANYREHGRGDTRLGQLVLVNKRESQQESQRDVVAVPAGNFPQENDNSMEEAIESKNLQSCVVKKSFHHGIGRGAIRYNAIDTTNPVDKQILAHTSCSPKIVKSATYGEGFTQISLTTNYVSVHPNTEGWGVYHYHVEFKPEENDTKLKKRLLRDHRSIIGRYSFDGASLFTVSRLHPEPLVLYSRYETSEIKSEITIKLVKICSPNGNNYLQIMNIVLRNLFETLGLHEFKRNFYDPTRVTKVSNAGIDLWEGYNTTIRRHEDEHLLAIDFMHKVVNTITCIQEMVMLRDFQLRNKDEISKHFVGATVMTSYNNKNYRVEKIEWDESPMSTFEYGNKIVTYQDYYKIKYGINLRSIKQPLFKLNDKFATRKNGRKLQLALVPELCHMTGYSENIRSNRPLMMEISTKLQIDPLKRVQNLEKFLKSIQDNNDAVELLKDWGLTLDDKFVQLIGHALPTETIHFGNRVTYRPPREQYNWNFSLGKNTMFKSNNLLHWTVIMPKTDDTSTSYKVIKTMTTCSTQMGFHMAPPYIHKLEYKRCNDYKDAIDEIMEARGSNLQLLFVVLPYFSTEIYKTVKRQASVVYGVISQCLTLNTVRKTKQLSSICMKLAVQINAKTGGTPWKIPIPIQGNLMVVGYDAYHSATINGRSVGALISTTSEDLTKTYSITAAYSSKNDICNEIRQLFKNCIQAYYNVNGKMPTKIIYYRDGIGEGQLEAVKNIELKGILEVLNEMYTAVGKPIPQFAFVVVSKRIITRIFKHNGTIITNPEPGTVVDSRITLPDRYDFFMISQQGGVGTISPTSYNVIYDTLCLTPAILQTFTFKLCHLYFNWLGTVTVPNVCQLAHKLAFLVGLGLEGTSSHKALSHSMHYL